MDFLEWAQFPSFHLEKRQFLAQNTRRFRTLGGKKQGPTPPPLGLSCLCVDRRGLGGFQEIEMGCWGSPVMPMDSERGPAVDH